MRFWKGFGETEVFKGMAVFTPLSGQFDPDTHDTEPFVPRHIQHSEKPKRGRRLSDKFYVLKRVQNLCLIGLT